MNIKNIICCLGLVSLGLVGCAASHPPAAANVRLPQPTAEVVPPVVEETPTVDLNAPVTVSGNAWSFVLPDGSWLHQDGDDHAVAKNAEDTIRIILLSQAWDKASGLFPMTVIHTFQKGGNSVKSYKKVTINGVQYIHVVMSRGEGVEVGMWLGVKNKVAYGFMCGGVKDENLFKTCDGIASTLKIN